MINKYLLYSVVLLLAVAFAWGPKLYYLLTWKRAVGSIAGYVQEEVGEGPGSYTKKYPRVRFSTGEYIITFLAPSFMYEYSQNIRKVEVLYNKKDPTKAFVNNFYGLWGSAGVYLLPFFLIWTGCFFAPGLIPKKIDFNKMNKKLFG